MRPKSGKSWRSLKDRLILSKVNADLVDSRGQSRHLAQKIKEALDKYAYIIHNDTYIYTFKELIMRTTLNIDDKLIGKASKLTGVKEKTSLVRLGLEALIALESSKRLAILGGTEKKLKPIPRRRSRGR